MLANSDKHRQIKRTVFSPVSAVAVDFADDIALLEESVQDMQHFTSVLEEEASKVGLYINPDKCKVMVSNTWRGQQTSMFRGLQ